MEHPLQVFNSLGRKKEPFIPLSAPFVGMYVCGPTVYGNAHLGHARSAISFDIVFRYLSHLGYKVRYVRNITDVGHLENDADEGDDKIEKKARLEQLEPMEVVQLYMDNYHNDLQQLNTSKPSIEPRASGHIPEQIAFIEKIIESGYGYVSEGSVYFDLVKYSAHYPYGELSGRIIEDLIAGAGNLKRGLSGQQEKHNAVDFALWKKASTGHIMRWNSPWGIGFPGWHLECSAMSAKYLGEIFDIHGGGADLMFPHHESEIAQTTACYHHGPCRYWLHNNMVTINGQKMGKSLGNSISLQEFYSGTHPLLKKAYAPMTIRFFMLQSHYRSTLDFSNEALEASEKGLKRLLNAVLLFSKIKPGKQNSFDVVEIKDRCFAAMNDDFNTPMAVAELFDGTRFIHALYNQSASLDEKSLLAFERLYKTFLFDIMGLTAENERTDDLEKILGILIEVRNQAKTDKNYTISDTIRLRLLEAGYQLNDAKDQTTWSRT